MSHHSGKEFLHDLSSAAKGIHGMGDAFRGTVNKEIDHAFHDHKGEERERAVAEKGYADMRSADQRLNSSHDSHTPHTEGYGGERYVGAETRADVRNHGSHEGNGDGAFRSDGAGGGVRSGTVGGTGGAGGGVGDGGKGEHLGSGPALPPRDKAHGYNHPMEGTAA